MFSGKPSGPRAEFRSGVPHSILQRERPSLKATSVAQLFKSAGYTRGIFGKWHLGDEAPYQPDRRGGRKRQGPHQKRKGSSFHWKRGVCPTR